MNIKEGLQRLKEQYGNPRAVFARKGKSLRHGQTVTVLPASHDENNAMVGCVIRNKNGFKVRVRKNGRTWFLNPAKHQVLEEW